MNNFYERDEENKVYVTNNLMDELETLAKVLDDKFFHLDNDKRCALLAQMIAVMLGD